MEGLVNFSPSRSFKVQDFFEYLLVVYPPVEVYDQIKKEKDYFSSEFNVSVVKNFAAHYCRQLYCKGRDGRNYHPLYAANLQHTKKF